MKVVLGTDLPNPSTNDITTPLTFPVVAGQAYLFLANLTFTTLLNAGYDFTIVGQFSTATVSGEATITARQGGAPFVNPQPANGSFLMNGSGVPNVLTIAGFFTALTSGAVTVSFSLFQPGASPVILKAGSQMVCNPGEPGGIVLDDLLFVSGFVDHVTAVNQ